MGQAASFPMVICHSILLNVSLCPHSMEQLLAPNLSGALGMRKTTLLCQDGLREAEAG